LNEINPVKKRGSTSQRHTQKTPMFPITKNRVGFGAKNALFALFFPVTDSAGIGVTDTLAAVFERGQAF
jgi:hypothetical protein